MTTNQCRLSCRSAEDCDGSCTTQTPANKTNKQPTGERAELIRKLYEIADALSKLMCNAEVMGDDPATVRKAAALLKADTVALDVQAGSIEAVQSANERLAARVRELEADAQRPALNEEWRDAFAAFSGAFDTPLARRRMDDEFCADARRRMRDFNDRMIEAAPGIKEQV